MPAASRLNDSRRHLSDAAPGVYLSPERVVRETALGYWPNRVLTDYFDANLSRRPDATAFAAYRTDINAETRYNYKQLYDRVQGIAAGLLSLGVGRGDVVSFQLPNWWQFVAVHLACVRVGAVSNPLMPMFRARELEFMLRRAQSQVLVTPQSFRKFDHAALGRQLLHSVPTLRRLLVIDGDGAEAFEAACQQDAPAGAIAARLLPNDLAKIMFTSGTTGEPKGVMHTSNTMLAGLAAVSERLGLSGLDVIFMPSPFAHSIGFIYGLCLSIYLGAPLITLDIWDPAKAVELLERHHVSFIFAATPFLLDLINVPDLRRRDLSSLRLFMISGAPIPRALVREAEAILPARIATGWGMTETTLATATDPAREREGRESDGQALPYAEVRVVDQNNQELPSGAEGRLQYRGSTLFVGYFKRPDLYGVDNDGWFDTGDRARMSADGYINIVARDKDIIIRGGENIPVVEVEALIRELPQVREAAVVGLPDPRLGERACACVVLRPGRTLTLQELIDFMGVKGLARQYLPERLEIIQDLPKTESGKVLKYVLKDLLAGGEAQRAVSR
jgi:cyclohexanecarboxylate-CoA ligase